ncbi:TIGR03084 family metal-binding protein [Jatrophihabitans fulvus]
MVALSEVLGDLDAEAATLDDLVAPLDDAGWRRATPAQGWTIAHQIAHLTWTDSAAIAAATGEGWDEFVATASATLDTFVDDAAERGAARPPDQLLAGWRDSRRTLREALVALPDGAKLPWFGPPMGAVSMATARLMETWAHGQDVADTLDVTRRPTDRLRGIAHIGVRTRDFSFRLRGLTPPDEPFRVELTGPTGDLWAWGPDDADQQVAGPALDFCLLVTQRRHRGELAVVAVGADADRWLDIAQAFAGKIGTGRQAP